MIPNNNESQRLFNNIIEKLVNDFNIKKYISDPDGIAHYYTYNILLKSIMNSKLDDIYNYFMDKDLFVDVVDYELEEPDKLSIAVKGYSNRDNSKYIEIIETIMRHVATTMQEDKQKGILYIEFTIPDLLTIEEKVKEKLSEKLHNMDPLVNDMELWNKTIQDIDIAYL